ncbi:hypothetical protein [Thermotalea metallivorans]|uniref:Uncharacterized protein n=1 Tax=Thermotalea metallivorans TaxID=520762 RepID=A0A140LCJ8_9FIRM|nr:hypothetical protein [Thermotalea metallivorans]KXG78273.1 hypothetical protein AN619_02480 [Thermotalea metallivorans]
MNQSQKHQLKENLKDLLAEETFNAVLKRSIGEIKFSKRRVFLLLILLLICSIPAINIGFSDNTIERIIRIIDRANALIVALLAILFTGYALFQALVSGNTLKQLLLHEEGKASMFKKYNLFFFILAITYLSIIIINFILILIFDNIPSDWQLPYFDTQTNSIIASILVSIYFLIIINSMIEMKCFLYNLYQCFSVNAVASTLNIIGKEEQYIEE